MSKWPIRELNELLVRMESGSRPKGGVSGIADGVPSLGGEHLNRDGGFSLEGVKFVPEEFFSQMGRGIIQREDILVVKDGATTGKTSFVEKQFPYERAAINEHVFLLRVNRTLVLPRFVFYFLFGPWGQAQILSCFRGAAIGGIGQDFVRSVEVPVPPLPEQERILRILDVAEALRRLRAQADQAASELIPAVFEHMFHATKEASWPRDPLKSFGVNVRYGLGQPPEEDVDGIPFVRATNIKRGRIVRNGLMKVSTSKVPASRNPYLTHGEVMVVRSGAYTGDVALVDAEWTGAIAGYDLVLTPSETIDGTFLTWLLLSRPIQEGYFAGEKHRAAQSHLNAAQLEQTPVFVPPMDLQRTFAARVAEIRAMESAQAASRQRLGDLFQSVLDRAFQGEL